MFNIISGIRRSGTSMLMYALRQAGMPVLGEKYCLDDLQDYVLKGNPNGYWELKGVTDKTGLTSKHVNIGDKGDLIKVMCECLWKSDPALVDKVVLIFRNPGQALHSLYDHNDINCKDLFTIQNMMDISDTFGFLKFYRKEYLIVFYKKILKDPAGEMRKICDFFGNTNWEAAAKTITKKLNRTKSKPFPNDKLMYEMYEWIRDGEIDRVIEYKTELKKLALKLLEKYDKNNPIQVKPRNGGKNL